MLFSYFGSPLLFAVITFGLSWPLVARFSIDPVEKIVAGIALSLVGIFLYAWMIYVTALPTVCFWALPAIAVAGLSTEWREFTRTLRDRDTARLVVAQIIISLWSVGWLALVLSYSGGGWLADWFGHLQRTWFFLDHGPRDILFNGFDPLTSRPPLANVVNGAFLEISRRDFSHYQLFSTLFSSLAFMPAGLLARRFGNGRAISFLTLLFMVSPMFAQNAAYAWTKLPAAFFVLTALYFFLRFHDHRSSRVDAVLFAVTLAAGLLTHYSAGPYAVILGVAWLWFGWSCRKEVAWQRSTAAAVVAGSLVLAVWFGWCFATYGLRGSLLTNTSITDKAPDAVAQIQAVVLNIRDTFVPHFLRTVDFELIAQRSSVGWWRDWFFQLYQINFFFAFGSVAWLAILIGLIKKAVGAPVKNRIFWTVFIIGNAILCVGVHGARDTWGLAHICLQPLVLAGLALLAASWAQFPRPWRLVLIAAATVDFMLGIALQFGVEAYAFERLFAPNKSVVEIVADYSRSTGMNFYAKMHNHWMFMGDAFIEYGRAVVGALALVFLLALLLAGRATSEPGSSGEKA
jgi:Dolichyl-phosphate-mannose-protein mannosyltransferase